MKKEMLILVDSREQQPYWKGKHCARTALNVGDYTTVALLNQFHIERKSMQDLYGTIIGHHARFRRECIRAKKNKTKLVVMVEGKRSQFIALEFPGGSQRNIKPETLRKIINTIEDRYAENFGVEFVWCSSRITAKKMVTERLEKEERKIRGTRTPR